MMLPVRTQTVVSGIPTVFVGMLFGVCCYGADSSEPYAFWHENVLGTSLQLHVAASSADVARMAEAAALDEIDRLTAILSTYTESSELNSLLRRPSAPRPVSPELLEVLRLYDHWRAASNGTMNPAVEFISRLWKRADRVNRIPSEAELREAVQAAATPAWEIHQDATVTFRAGAPVNVDAIAKGYIIDRAGQAALHCHSGVYGLLLDIGGDMRAFGQVTEQVGIADPASPGENGKLACEVALSDRAIATSGGYERGFEIDGARYSHLIDPRSGRPVDRISSATAIAPTAAQADALATILSVLAPEEGLALVEGLPQTECLLIFRDGGRRASRGWMPLARHAVGKPPATSPSPAGEVTESMTLLWKGSRAAHVLLAAQTGAPASDSQTDPSQPGKEPETPTWWGQEFEALVDFQIAPARGWRYQRPYVAVWIEDASGKPVRTLALWYGHPQWLPDLRRWYSQHWRDRRLLQAVSRASRSPGRYRILWDGAGNDGRYVPSGKYTFWIEAAREHGTYQLMRKEVDLSDRPFTVELGRNAEISLASLVYREKAPPKSQ